MGSQLGDICDFTLDVGITCKARMTIGANGHINKTAMSARLVFGPENFRKII